MSESCVSVQTLESLVSISADGDSFYVLASTIQSLYTCLKEDDINQRQRSLLETDGIFTRKLSQYSEAIVLTSAFSRNGCSSNSRRLCGALFKQRFAKAEIHELLKHHHKLTGKWLILTHVDYDHQKFKVKQV